jgi:hypothetical protein
MLAVLIMFLALCLCITIVALVALSYRNSEVAEKAIENLGNLGHLIIRKLGKK